MKKNCFNWYHVVAFDSIKILTLKVPQNDCLDLTSVKDFDVVAKKMARNGHKMAIYESKNFVFFLTKLKIKENEKNCDLCCSVWFN